MEIRDIILKINQQVPEATAESMMETTLKVTDSGVKELPPSVIGKVKSAFVDIMNKLPEDAFDQFLQYLIALEYHRNATAGLHATQVPMAFEELPQRNLLFELNFPDNLRGWAVADSKPEKDEDDDAWGL